jgi:hypothetical protein
VGAEAAPYVAPAAGSPAAAGRAADPNGVMEEQAPPERTESPKQRKVKTGVNLRKSLAWDSAFFTSEGLFYPGQCPDVSFLYTVVVLGYMLLCSAMCA